MSLPSFTSAQPIGRVGLWRDGSLLTPKMGAAVERLGYSMIWVGRSPDARLEIAERLLDATEHLRVATGIVNIWKSPASEVAASFHRLERKHPSRFLLGIGIGHRESLGGLYQEPYAALVSYLDILDAEGVPVERRVISALGPRTLKLSAERSAGTHPYMTTPTHTRFARSVVGPGRLIAAEQRLVANTNGEAAREIARTFLAHYLSLSNYRRTLESHGFSAAELENRVSDDVVDALVPHGTPSDLARAVQSHLDAGANHVCVQILPAEENPLVALESLASELRLG